MYYIDFNDDSCIGGNYSVLLMTEQTFSWYTKSVGFLACFFVPKMEGKFCNTCMILEPIPNKINLIEYVSINHTLQFYKLHSQTYMHIVTNQLIKVCDSLVDN